MKQSESLVFRRVTRFFAAVAVLLMLPGVAAADIYTLEAFLDGLQETPPVATPGSGSATITLDDVTGAVTVLTGSYADLIGTTTDIHIHGLAPPGTPAGVLFGLTLDAPGTTTGTFSGGGVLSPANVAGMIAGSTYINIHSTFRPGGEIRGQLTVVPEPSTIVLGGLCSLALLERFHFRCSGIRSVENSFGTRIP